MKTIESKSSTSPTLQCKSNAAPFFQPEETQEPFFNPKQSGKFFSKFTNPVDSNSTPTNTKDSSTIQSKLATSNIQRKPAENASRNDFPWTGIINTWSAALRKNPKKDPNRPYDNILADLPRRTEAKVVGRKGGWLLVNVTISGKVLDGFVSQELVTFVRKEVPPIEIVVKIPSLAEAFVELKKAEKKKADGGTAFQPSAEEQSRIELAISVIKKTKKYVVNESTYIVSFAQNQSGNKTEVVSIEDFILFVEYVERTYSGASPKDVASEVRQLWFSDVNWELLVDSGGISAGGKEVDIESEPDPIAKQFNMKTLAPAAGSKQIDTRMGRVDIGHVMAGIDASLSGFPSTYPKTRLAGKGHDDSDAKLKYETLKNASGGDSRDFTTWAGDLGQAYAEYLVDRFVKGNSTTSLLAYINDKAPSEEILGDIQGYIAVEVWKKVPASKSPSGSEFKVSNILRDLYLVDKTATSDTYKKYFEMVSGKPPGNMKPFILERTLRFSKPWYAKKAIEHRGYWGSTGFTSEGILSNAMDEFDKKHAENERIAGAGDNLNLYIDNLFKQLDSPIQ